FRIHTTLDMRRQRAAEAALRRGLEDLERRLGFSGPLGHLEPEQRRKLASGRPRPLGPAGFAVEDAEQSGVQSGVTIAIPEPHAALIDATQPGAHLPEPMARYVAGEAWAARRRSAANHAAPAFSVDPDTIYAATITGLGKRVTLASGGLVVALD